MNKVTRNPGCQHACRLDPEASGGFVIEEGCPVHGRAGYRLFDVVWLGACRPWLVGSITLGYYAAPAAAPHEHVHCYSFVLGMN